MEIENNIHLCCVAPRRRLPAQREGQMPLLEVRSPQPAPPTSRTRHYFLGAPFDTIAQDAAIDLVSNSESLDRFRYIVTPNVDHVVRLNGDRLLAPYYDDAWMSLCDSKPISTLSHAVALDLPLVTGSDLTARIFKTVIRPGDRITLIAANSMVSEQMETMFPGVRFRSLVPPPNVLKDPAGLQACVDFVAAEPARFVFIAIGSPQSEKIAYALAQRPEACGVGLCIGASLEFLLGAKARAPIWMRQLGLEWAHRLASDPRRLWRRYVFAVGPLLHLFARELFSRHHQRQ
ncbi:MULTISPECIES: WecB/TagA/CpsF family glycosyltransferase [unclassified Rhizobium]|uniref:WecB/TagA/CpsF family glycosyltransferase n=1 Tax=unclassified Rhizobium TaxID=2613769 RepID=UPI001FD7FDDC|nr:MULTISPECIES: WecB/TagA/CpsF family glycosyltransferase [unclassified Rhizobium]